MRHSKAPAGFYTAVEVILRLHNQRTLTYHWTTPMGLHAALHKAPAWAREEMKKEGVRGRSRVVGLNVEARYAPGSYRRT